MRVPSVLVVEDEHIVALDLSDTLTSLGYDVLRTVDRGEDAVSRARDLRPSIVLMDIRLAGAMDGIEAAERIRAETDTPIIFLTSHADDETLRRAKRPAPYGYLVKPFRSEDLRCAVEIALAKHEAEQTVRRRERLLSTTLRSIGDAVVTTDTVRRVTLFNPVAERLTGWSADEATGRLLDEILVLIAERTREPVALPLAAALETRAIVELEDEALLVDRSGTERTIDDSAAPIIDDRGELLGGVMVFRDVTRHREIERELQALNDELEHRVLERMRELEDTYAELESFSYAIANDLRAPLRSIRAFSEALAEDHIAQLDQEGVRFVGLINRSAKHMAEQIEDLIRLTRTTNAPLERRPVDITSLSTTLVDALSPPTDATVVIAPGLRAIGDYGLVRILLANLIGNAIKFRSPQRPLHLEISATERDGLACIAVSDNGVGFDPAPAAAMFASSQRTARPDATTAGGVGLTIVTRVIHRHGGRIWVESELDRGSTFTFAL